MDIFSHSSHTEKATGKLCNHDVLLETCKTGSAQMSGGVVNGSNAEVAL